jgi:hypothetical protein
MPAVHVADPISTLNFINIDQVLEWENYTNGKLIAVPFGVIKSHKSVPLTGVVRPHSRHSALTQKIRATITTLERGSSLQQQKSPSPTTYTE